MTTLLINGTTNQYTFTNAIVAANIKSNNIFGAPLSNIYVMHSKESEVHLRNNKDWLQELQCHNLGKEILIERVIEISSEEKASVNRLVNYLEVIVKGSADDSSPESKLIVDLTNGTTFQKNILSIAAYLLELKHQYLIDIVKLSELTRNLEKPLGFLSNEILIQSYISAPDSTQLDRIAYLNLAEVFRYKQVIEYHAQMYERIDKNHSNKFFFAENLVQSIQIKLRGDTRKDNRVVAVKEKS